MNNHSDKSPYALAVGQEANQRLDFQNSLLEKQMMQAFENAASFKKIKGATIVDFGCGTASAYAGIRSFIGPSGQYIGIDSSQEQIAFNQCQLKEPIYIVGDENSSDAQRAISTADILYLRCVVMHQKNPKSFVENLYKTAPPGALIIVQEPEDTPECKAEMVAKYPLCGDLCDLKVTLGKRLGLDYSFAKHLAPIFKELAPQKLIHKTESLYIPLAHAKKLLAASLNEITRNNKGLFTNQEITHYLHTIVQLPEEEGHTWNLDLFHTFIVQKKC